MARLKRQRRLNHDYRSRYRKALSTLLKETDQRCAYSLQHVDDCGESQIEVDHYDPRRTRGKRLNFHGNLIAASRTCNNKKGDWWPTPEEEALGLKIINPYDDHDYGKHIVEDSNTGEVKGLTPTGKWHITMLALNAPHLVRRRQLRSQVIATALHAAGATGAHGRQRDFEVLQHHITTLKAKLDPFLIPPLPTKRIY